MDKLKNKKIRKERCLLCGRLTTKFWVVGGDYDHLKPYHQKCRNKLVSVILKNAGLLDASKKSKTTEAENSKIMKEQKDFRDEMKMRRKPYQWKTKTELIDKILELETKVKDLDILVNHYKLN
jgi:hypothetical protein